MRQINKIIVHCSATREGENYTVDTIRSWHVDGRGWSDIGYHFYIDLYGEIHKGRDIAKIGAHSKGQNRNLAVLRTLKAMYPEATIHGHRDFANKACPSFDATEEYKDL
jgi:N-acetylmuramoyl-L-alanine amidase